MLVTGASGYVGGRLVRRLLDAGWHVRCVTRSPGKLAARPWATKAGVEIVEADARDAGAMADAMRGCGSAFYLVHSMMASGGRYAADDRRMAEQFARAAAAAGLARIVYLGGLGEAGADLSEHLASRRDVERILAAGPVPVTVLRAAMIVGAGSASFEILRYLVERLPVMVTPRWVHTECQPIAVDNVVAYLVACLDTPETVGRTFDVGGPDVVTYRQLMDVLADEAGLRRRLVIPVPVLTPRLSSLWIHLVTPVSHRIARPLAEGLRNRVVCRDDAAQRLMPQRLLTAREAIRLAFDQERAGEVETAWTDAGLMPGDPDWAGGTMFTDRRETLVAAPARRGVARGVPARRPERLVRRPALAATRRPRPPARRPRSPPRAPRSRTPRVRRRAGLLAGDGHRDRDGAWRCVPRCDCRGTRCWSSRSPPQDGGAPPRPDGALSAARARSGWRTGTPCCRYTASSFADARGGAPGRPRSGLLGLELRPARVETIDLGARGVERGVALLERDRIGGDRRIVGRALAPPRARASASRIARFHAVPLALLVIAETP